MSEIWNNWEVKPPPICTVRTRLNMKGITALREVTHDALNTVRGIPHFDKEAAILSRFLYRKKRVFRHDKGMQVLVKMHQCLKRYLKIDMSGLLFDFKKSIPYKYDEGATHAFLPTRQMLKWVLVRLQAFSKLFVRLIELSKAAGAYTYNKLCLGWALHNTFFVFCITARILATSKFLVAKAIELYSSFYKCLPYLDETAEFFPGYDIPVDLKTWLGPVDLSPLKKKTFVDDIFEFVDLVQEEENEGGEVKIVAEKFLKKFFKTETVVIDSDVEEIEEPEEEEEEEEKEKDRKGVKRPLIKEEDRKRVKRPLINEEDLGVPVEKEKFFERPRKKKKKKEKEGARVKWLKKLKKTVSGYERKEGEGHGWASGSCLSFNDSYVTID